MTFQQNRRAFLTTWSAAFAATALGVPRRPLRALPMHSRLPVYAHMSEIIDPNQLRQLARRAVEAAIDAGASYADIRIADKHTMGMRISQRQPVGGLGYHYSYGIRTLVDGSWAFGYGAEPTLDGIAKASQEVVSTAKAARRIAGPKPSMVSIPVVTGEWETPVGIDPFSVSPDEHAYMCGAYMGAGARVPDAGSGIMLDWSREIRVFASSEGALTTQVLRSARPSVSTKAQDPFGISASLPFTPVTPKSAGFEILIGTELQDQLKMVAEEAVRLLSYPVGETDVGRFEAVMDGQSVGSVLASTLLPALDLDRAIGNQADEVGTSFLTPHDATLGQQRFSSQLSFRTERGVPAYGAARWDDEGVVVTSFPLMDKGKVVDFLGTRKNIHVLHDWYRSSNQAMLPRGAAIAWTAEREPMCGAPAVVMEHDSSTETLDTLVRRVKNGVLIRGTGYVNSDQQLTGGMMVPNMLFEVKNGQIQRRLKGAMIQFRTETLWKGVTAVGGANSQQVHAQTAYVGQPWSVSTQAVTAPAAYFSEIDVTRFPRYNTSSAGGFFTL